MPDHARLSPDRSTRIDRGAKQDIARRVERLTAIARQHREHDAKIYICDAATGDRKATLEGHTNYGVRSEFHPGGTLLASTSWDGRLRLWDAQLGRPVLSVTSAHDRVELSRDGRIVDRREDHLTTYQFEPALEYRNLGQAPNEPVKFECVSIEREGRILAVGTETRQPCFGTWLAVRNSRFCRSDWAGTSCLTRQATWSRVERWACNVGRSNSM